MRIRFRVRQIAIASLAATCLSSSVAMSRERTYVYWPKREPLLMNTDGTRGEQHDPTKIELSLQSPLALTVGQSVSIGLTAEGANNDVSYRAAATSVMPGLSINPTSGLVSGVPNAPAGTVYSIAVEAVRDGSVIGTTDTVFRTLRAPLTIDKEPDGIEFTAGEPFPSSGVAVGTAGGDQNSITWALLNAPDWLSIIRSDPGIAVLRQTPGVEVAETPPTTVTIVASDAEGRQDTKSFEVEISAPGDADEFDPGPLRVGGVMMGRGLNSQSGSIGGAPGDPNVTPFLWERDTTLFGLLVSGGQPPYTISARGDSASAPITYYRMENFQPNTFTHAFGTQCGLTPGDSLCLFNDGHSGAAGVFSISRQPVYTTSTQQKFKYVDFVSDCDIDVSGSKPLREIFPNWISGMSSVGTGLGKLDGIMFGNTPTFCGGYDQNSILGAIELDLAPFVETAPGNHFYTFTVSDANGETASTDATIRVHPVPILLGESTKTLTVGVAYTTADHLLDLAGGFEDLTVSYANSNRVPGLDLVEGHLTGAPTQTGQWVLSFTVADRANQTVTVNLNVEVAIDCGLPTVFSTAGTFNYSPPDACPNLVAEAWGGGGNGGAGDYSRAGNGGGGGAYVLKEFRGTEPTYSITVGGPQQDSSVKAGNSVIALAKGAKQSSGGSQFQSVGDTIKSGGNGGSGLSAGGKGGKAGGIDGGDGGAGGASARAGAPGLAPGGGGGGGGAFDAAGGTGAVGRVVIQAFP